MTKLLYALAVVTMLAMAVLVVGRPKVGGGAVVSAPNYWAPRPGVPMARAPIVTYGPIKPPVLGLSKAEIHKIVEAQDRANSQIVDRMDRGLYPLKR